MSTDAPAVLLVKDNPDDEELTLRGLRHANLTNPVDVARDGQEALDYLFGNHDQAAKLAPLVVLLDLHLPRVEGFEVLKRIRAEERT
jgi:two-component system response regulator